MATGHIMHRIVDSQQKNDLFYSPIPETAQNILDIGAGTGDWARDVADRFPSALVYGVDLFPTPDTWVPPNCKFEVDDVLEPWMYSQKFDLIHLRMMHGSFTDEQWRLVYKQAYNALARRMDRGNRAQHLVRPTAQIKQAALTSDLGPIATMAPCQMTLC